MIVAYTFEDHYVAYPLYTHNTKGLKSRNVLQRREFVSILDHRLRGTKQYDTWKAQTWGKPLETKYMVKGQKTLHALSTCNFTYPCCRSYHHKVRMMGYLTDDCVIHLLNLTSAHVPYRHPMMTKGEMNRMDREEAERRKSDASDAAGVCTDKGKGRYSEW